MISVCNVCHTYNQKTKQEILHDITVDIPESKFVILLGQSGSGKTTLLNIIAGLMKPTEGKVFFNNESMYNKSQDQLCDFRRINVGFIFQNFFLENSYTAGENVLVPLLLNKKMSNAERKLRVQEVLSLVGLVDRIDSRPYEMSGGECQRISIARAIANKPKIIIADEPTGNLDSVNGRMIVELLKQQTELGKTVLMVTHNESYVQYADVVLRIADGVLI